MSCCKKCCIPPYFFLLSNLNNIGNIRGSFVAVLQELDAQQNVTNTITAQGQLVGSATSTNLSLTSANVSVTSSNGNSVGNFGLFLNGAPNNATLGVTYSNFTSSFIDSLVATGSTLNNIPGSNTLTGTNVAFDRAPTPTNNPNYNYVITITIN